MLVGLFVLKSELYLKWKRKSWYGTAFFTDFESQTDNLGDINFSIYLS